MKLHPPRCVQSTRCFLPFFFCLPLLGCECVCVVSNTNRTQVCKEKVAKAPFSTFRLVRRESIENRIFIRLQHISVQVFSKIQDKPACISLTTFDFLPVFLQVSACHKSVSTCSLEVSCVCVCLRGCWSF